MLKQNISLPPSTLHVGHPLKPLELSTEVTKQRKASSLCEEITMVMLTCDVQINLVMMK
jgi:hypothetical protein